MQNQVIGFLEQAMPIQQSYDTQEDVSYQKYLCNGNVLANPQYKPSDLVQINSAFTANNSKKFYLREIAAQQFADLARNFRNENKGAKVFITSAYRSAKYQETLLKNWCSRAKCAKAGASEHQLWLAIDLAVLTPSGKYIALKKGNPYYERLYTRGADRWFHNTYQKWVEVDGQIEEWRHRRFVGTELAQTLRDTNQTFAERYNEQSTLEQIPDYLANY
jgi:LAS superfamily LD-carboxypeptidase LdcB